MKDLKNNPKVKELIEKFHKGRDWVLTHRKLVMPIFLLVCVLLTVLIALNANRRDKLEKEAKSVSEEMANETASADVSVISTPEYELELNAYQEVNELVKKYYTAQAEGDIDTISSLNSYLNDIEKLRIKQLSGYIDSYNNIEVYTKPGLKEKSFVAYVCAEVKFCDYDATLPGMQTYYVSTDEAGNYQITDGTYDDAVYEYIKSVTVQDDVVDLNNKVVVEYNDLLEKDPDLNDYIVYIKSVINEEVGEMLAEEEVPADSIETEQKDTNTTGQTTTIVNKVKAVESVNIRKSDSKDSERLGTAVVGQEFVLVEKKANGWSEVEYNGGVAYINSDYLTDVNTITVEVDAGTTEPESDTAGKAKKANDTAKTDADVNAKTESTTNTNETASGYVKVNTSGVRIRKEPNTTSDVLGTVYVGTKLDYLGKEGDWSKITFEGKTGYIKSEYVTKE